LSSEEESDEAQYIALLESLLKENSFYFSYTFDLTRNIQSNVSNPDNSPEEHFWWNKYLSNDLIHFKANEFILPIIRGFVEVENVQLESNHFVFGLISRQSCKRTGTRYNVRGIDQTGNVANFCETEQFIICRIFRFLTVFRQEFVVFFSSNSWKVFIFKFKSVFHVRI
jgi:phosphatidylinositol 4-phosphatase